VFDDLGLSITAEEAWSPQDPFTVDTTDYKLSTVSKETFKGDYVLRRWIEVIKPSQSQDDHLQKISITVLWILYVGFTASTATFEEESAIDFTSAVRQTKNSKELWRCYYLFYRGGSFVQNQSISLRILGWKRH
jgi:hypothetical protein